MAQVSHEQVAEVTKLKGPPKYNVIMLNDDSTPMEFVITVLTNIFGHTTETAKV